MTMGSSASAVVPLAFRHQPAAWAWSVSILSTSLLAWFVALLVMADMDQGPGTPLHSLPLFLVGWVLMLTAMMLPSELTYVGALAALVGEKSAGATARVQTVGCFIFGYALAWLGYGLIAYVLDYAVRSAALDFMVWYRAGPLVAASVLFVAGLYQVSALKHSCLNHCRSPLSFFARHWRQGRQGAVRMGLRHGLVCVGCCWALTAVMFAIGIMSLTWMALLTLFMFVEKVMPRGHALTIPIACFLWIMGLWIAVSPETAPLLKDPILFGAVMCRS